MEEKDARAGDIRKVYAHARSSGFNAKAMRQIIRIRELTSLVRLDYQDMLAICMRAHGMTQTQIDEALTVTRTTV